MEYSLHFLNIDKYDKLRKTLVCRNPISSATILSHLTKNVIQIIKFDQKIEKEQYLSTKEKEKEKEKDE